MQSGVPNSVPVVKGSLGSAALRGGMRAYVARLADVAELEALVAAGIPPIVSVSFDWLHGGEWDQNNGHLVVCAGFTEQGDAVVNDPWARSEKGERVRQIVPRENLARAWLRSRRTVCLIDPESWRISRGATPWR